MLTAITLYTLNKIFTEVSDRELSPMAKMLYINCLTHHFEDKKPTTGNAVAFSLFKDEIPSFRKYEQWFLELHKAGLISLEQYEIRFNNCWGRFIEMGKLDKVSAEHFVGTFSSQGVEAYEQELKTSVSLQELVQMKNKITKKQVSDLIDIFIKEQKAFEKKYTNYGDCAKHFLYWVPSNVNKSQNENVKTGAKILGLNK